MSCFAPRALASTSTSRASSYPLQSRSVLHYPRKWVPKKFRAQPHPSSFAQTLESGAVFTYNPPSSAPDFNSAFPSLPASESPAALAAQNAQGEASTSSSSSSSPTTLARDPDSINVRLAAYQSAPFDPLAPIVSPTTGRALPLAWKKVPGYGHLAPRIDKRAEGTLRLKGFNRELVDEEMLGKVKALQQEGKSHKLIARELNLYPRSFPDVDVKPSNPNGPGLTREQREFEQDLRLERQTLAQAHTRDSRVLRKAWW